MQSEFSAVLIFFINIYQYFSSKIRHRKVKSDKKCIFKFLNSNFKNFEWNNESKRDVLGHEHPNFIYFVENCKRKWLKSEKMAENQKKNIFDIFPLNFLEIKVDIQLPRHMFLY